MAIKHSKVSAVADGGDATLVRPSDWNASHDWTEAVTATTNSVSVPLTINQYADPAFVGAPALTINQAPVSADLVVIKNDNGDTMIAVRATGQIYGYKSNGDVSVRLGGAIGIATDGVTMDAGGGGVTIHPTETGSDGLFIDSAGISPVDGASTIRLVNPIGDMVDAFYTASSMTVNASLANGAARVLLKGKTVDGTVVSAYIPMTPAGGAVGGAPSFLSVAKWA